jgi:hypothetical protein
MWFYQQRLGEHMEKMVFGGPKQMKPDWESLWVLIWLHYKGKGGFAFFNFLLYYMKDFSKRLCMYLNASILCLCLHK